LADAPVIFIRKIRIRHIGISAWFLIYIIHTGTGSVKCTIGSGCASGSARIHIDLALLDPDQDSRVRKLHKLTNAG
jgi:hypothetical protein